ncbi:MAG: DUF1697 domain-containing protein [Pseudonocardiales bacterium]
MKPTRQVALLRGVNVGGRSTIAMADLRRLVTGLGYEGVRTLLQSGNVVLTASKAPATVAREIEKAIAKELGADPKVLVRTRDELAAVIEGNPMPAAVSNGARFFVTFLSGEPPKGALSELDPVDFAPDEFRGGGREIYLHCPDGVHDSRLARALSEKRLGVIATTRNWNTVTKLLATADEE